MVKKYAVNHQQFFNRNCSNIARKYQAVNERLDTAARVIRDVEKEVGQMSEIGRNMRELQDFLKSPKLRGNIGEQVLKDLIAQCFPKPVSFYSMNLNQEKKLCRN